MIKDQSLRNGGWSVSAIFREARQHRVLRHVVRAAGRQWWRKTVERTGAYYTCVWLHKHPAEPSAPAPGWCVERQRWNASGAYYVARAKQDGFEVHDLPLSWPHLVFSEAAQEFGLTCSICDRIGEAEYYEQRFLCHSCTIEARRMGGVEALLASKILKELARRRKAERNAVLL